MRGKGRKGEATGWAGGNVGYEGQDSEDLQQYRRTQKQHSNRHGNGEET